MGVPGTCNGTDMRKAYKFVQALGRAPEVTIEHYRRNNTNFGTYSDWELDAHQITPIYPQTIYGTIRNDSGTIPQNPPKFDSGYTTEYIRKFLIL